MLSRCHEGHCCAARMILAGFSFQDKLGRFNSLRRLLLADTSMEVVLGMLFLSFSDADIRFTESLFEEVI